MPRFESDNGQRRANFEAGTKALETEIDLDDPERLLLGDYAPPPAS
ncbi:hypothetical protein G6O69_35090 [Pseudenhygromyxa sp. WMMC2535]|nr:hypothetical protein [Pseudenhygromyxa sp. WMMC2535]NVB43102.1 hypothetical protein [Pseudenhygromyxa sp. WMMC2535]